MPGSTPERRPPAQPGTAAVHQPFPDLIRFVVIYGILAPSAGNCQLWKFHYNDRRLWVVHDRVRSQNLLNPHYYTGTAIVGAASKNMVIAAAHRAYQTQVEAFPQPEKQDIASTGFFHRRPGKRRSCFFAWLRRGHSRLARCAGRSMMFSLPAALFEQRILCSTKRWRSMPISNFITLHFTSIEHKPVVQHIASI